jgi:hypothetical protein
MTKPLIFTISAAWDDEASVWTGHCDDIPAAADAPTLDELLAKISAMALDLLPDNHPGVLHRSTCRSPRCATLNLLPPRWLRSSTAPSGNCCAGKSFETLHPLDVFEIIYFLQR